MQCAPDHYEFFRSIFGLRDFDRLIHLLIGIPIDRLIVMIPLEDPRVSTMPTNRAYGTCYAIATNMLTHGLHGPHAVIIMDLDVHGHALYKYRHDTLQPPMVA